jgi:hypothetical protein
LIQHGQVIESLGIRRVIRPRQSLADVKRFFVKWLGEQVIAGNAMYLG